MQGKNEYRLVVFFNQFGPYHLARLNAAARHVNLTGVEVFSESSVYDWGRQSKEGVGFEWINLFSSENHTDKTELFHSTRALLDRLSPDVVAVHGWSEPAAFAALNWCGKNGVPAICLSESSEGDDKRSWYREWIKSKLVSGFSAALVGGKKHSDYLERLGMEKESIFTPYDVVDNNYFSNETNRLRQERNQNLLPVIPHKYFLSSARFITKKNLPFLIEAYGEFRKAAVQDPPHLVIMGDGVLRKQLEEMSVAAGLKDFVHLPGFISYKELPVYYSGALAFIHASTVEQWGLVVNEAMASSLPVLVSDRCGCAGELVKESFNGFTFDPYDHQDLVTKMLRIIKVNNLRQMGENSRSMIAAFGPEAFGRGLKEAADYALEKGPEKGFLQDMLTRSLAYK